MRRWPIWRRWFSWTLLAILGCSGSVEHRQAASRARERTPIERLYEAVAARDWSAGQRLCSEVLTLHPDDADAIALVARTEYGLGRTEIAAELMMDACAADSYADEKRVAQAMAALLSLGRLFDCMDFLEVVLAKQPDAHVIRWRLFEMYWGVEDLPRSRPHYIQLIRKRQFDVDLMLAGCHDGTRRESPDSMVEMVKRNPGDTRPLVAQARVHFDQARYKAAAMLLLPICESHPTHGPAVALCCKSLVRVGNSDAFTKLVASADREAQNYESYWVAWGDWSRDRGLHQEAVRGYWEATQRNANSREAWERLSVSLRRLPTNKQPDQGCQEAIQSVNAGVVQLTRLSQLLHEFSRSGKASQRIACQIAESLADLGRLWEAEAWAAMATQLPRVDVVSVADVRGGITRRLRRATPWQSATLSTEAIAAMEEFPLPSSDATVSVARAGGLRTTRSFPRSEAVIRLANQAESQGLRFFGTTGDRLEEPGVRHFETLGCGGGCVDMDLDGWPDLYLVAAGGRPAALDSQSNTLWRNLGGRFRDVTAASHTQDHGFGQSVAVGDLNEDGFPDLLLLNYGPNEWLCNNGDGTFQRISDHMQPHATHEVSWSTSGAIADINQDGLADAVVLTYGEGLEPVNKVCRQGPEGLARACSPLVFPAAKDRILFNDGSGGLVDVTDQWPEPTLFGRGLGISVGEFHGDAGLELLIANDLSSNHLWSQSGRSDRRFQESAILLGLASDNRAPAQGSMGIACGDLDHDGDADFYVTNFAGEANTYHQQMTGSVWEDRTQALGMFESSLPLVGFGTQAVDLDNDMVDEIVVTNGHVDQYPGEGKAPYAQPMQIYRRTESGPFELVSDLIRSSYVKQPHIGRSLWTVDSNRDGRSDLVVTHQSEPVALLLNETEDSGSWIQFKMVGSRSSRDAIGAIVRLKLHDRELTRYVTSGDGYLCSNERLIRFGLGDFGDAVLAVTVDWFGGARQEFQYLQSRKTWLLVEGVRSAFMLSQ